MVWLCENLCKIARNSEKKIICRGRDLGGLIASYNQAISDLAGIPRWHHRKRWGERKKKSNSRNHFLSRLQSNKGKKCFDCIVARSVSLAPLVEYDDIELKEKHLAVFNSSRFSLLILNEREVSQQLKRATRSLSWQTDHPVEPISLSYTSHNFQSTLQTSCTSNSLKFKLALQCIDKPDFQSNVVTFILHSAEMEMRAEEKSSRWIRYIQPGSKHRNNQFQSLGLFRGTKIIHELRSRHLTRQRERRRRGMTHNYAAHTNSYNSNYFLWTPRQKWLAHHIVCCTKMDRNCLCLGKLGVTMATTHLS